MLARLLVALLLLLAAGPAAAGPLADQPVRIEADRMETVRQENLVRFSGNVVARQGDLTIHADTMTVHYAKENKESGGAGQAVEHLEASGHVQVGSRQWTASGDHLEYRATAALAVLTGNAVAWQGANRVSGERIELHLDEDRTVVERQGSGSGRVQALFYPGGEAADTGKDATGGEEQ